MWIPGLLDILHNPLIPWALAELIVRRRAPKAAPTSSSVATCRNQKLSIYESPRDSENLPSVRSTFNMEKINSTYEEGENSDGLSTRIFLPVCCPMKLVELSPEWPNVLKAALLQSWFPGRLWSHSKKKKTPIKCDSQWESLTTCPHLSCQSSMGLRCPQMLWNPWISINRTAISTLSNQRRTGV